MKATKIMFKSAAIMLFCLVFLIPSPIWASDTEALGQKIQLSEVTRISKILASPDDYVGKRVLIKGMVIDVCPKRGCWMDIASDKEFEKIQVKVTDGEIVFPMSAKGKEALVEGTVEALRYSKEDAVAWLQHKAEESGQPFDPKSVTGPLTIYRIKGLGAEIMDK